MKKYIFILFLMAFYSHTNAQPTPPKATYLKDTAIAGKTLKLFIGSRGGKFTVRTSKTTGKEYKQYFK